MKQTRVASIDRTGVDKTVAVAKTFLDELYRLLTTQEGPFQIVLEYDPKQPRATISTYEETI